MNDLISISRITDQQFFIGVAIFCLLMIALCLLGYSATRRQRKRQFFDDVTAELHRRIAENSAHTPDFTAVQLRAAADTNSRRAIARDSQKGTTHE